MLEIYPGRTFRFSPNNPLQAELVVRCVRTQNPTREVGRAILVVDQADPYSEDLAAAFEQVIQADVPKAAVVVVNDVAFSPGLTEIPGPAEQRAAARLWALAQKTARERATWVILPLQGGPTRRLLAALKTQAPAARDRPGLDILCGDGIGVETLRTFAGTPLYSLWCASADLTPQIGQEMARDIQVPAEIVSALVFALDRAEEGAGGLREALARMDLGAEDAAALGRVIAFDERGERRGLDLGLVLAIHPGRNEVMAYAPGANQEWSPPVAVPPVPTLAGDEYP